MGWKLLGIFILLFPLLSAQRTATLGGVMAGVSGLCGGVNELLPVAAMLMVTLGAVVYASGQIMGAETRARANVWATAALTGAVTALLIFSVSPPVLKSMYSDMRSDCRYACKGSGAGATRLVAAGAICCQIGTGDVWGYGCPTDHPKCTGNGKCSKSDGTDEITPSSAIFGITCPNHDCSGT